MQLSGILPPDVSEEQSAVTWIHYYSLCYARTRCICLRTQLDTRR